jgi:transposase
MKSSKKKKILVNLDTKPDDNNTPWFAKFIKANELNLWMPLTSTLNTEFHKKDISTQSWFSTTERCKDNLENLKINPLPKLICELKTMETYEEFEKRKKTEITKLKKSKKTDLDAEISKIIPKETKGNPNGILKVKLYPTDSQRKKLNLMFYANRYAWNLLIEKMGDKTFSLTKEEINADFRPFIKKSGIDASLKVFSCPIECFDSAYQDTLTAIKSTKALSAELKKKNGTGFTYPDKLKYKTKKGGGNSIEIRGSSIRYDPDKRTISLYPRYFEKGENHIKMKTNLTKIGLTEFNHSVRLCYIDGDFYLNIPYTRKVESVIGNKICALDPGVRTFMTGYDPEGRIFEIMGESDTLNKLNLKLEKQNAKLDLLKNDKRKKGEIKRNRKIKNINARIKSLVEQIDNHKVNKSNDHIYKRKLRIEYLQKKLSNTKNHIERIKISKEIKNLYTKIKNCVNDMHHKVSKMLSQTYKQVLLPTFETKKMVDNTDGKRKIGGLTAYNMNTLSHYKFKLLLKHKMNLRNGKLIICTEEYTSKTCGNCGRLNHNLGSSKVFKCPYDGCSVEMDRDINASRNIFILNHHLLNKT